jgi:hypothetical protein
LYGCSSEQISPPVSKETNQQQVSSDSTPNTKLNIVRARGRSNYGELSLACKDEEKVQQLGADSSFGKAADYSFTGDYDVIFKTEDGKKTAVTTLNDLTIIQPQNSVMKLNKLHIGDTDVFYFIPEYSGSNDVPIRFFGITKQKGAFQFSIENNKAQHFGDTKALSDSTVVLSTTSKRYTPPEIVGKGNIALTAVYNIGEGQNFKTYKVIFKVDMKNRIFKYISKKEIKL